MPPPCARAKLAAMSSAASDVPLARLATPHGELVYTSQGEGPTLVALHGLPGSVRDFRRLAKALEEQPVRFVRLNLPGFAGSAPAGRPSDWDALIEASLAAARELAQGPFVLLGHSFGGLVALRAATRSPDVRGLVLLAPAGLRAHRAVRLLGPTLGLRALRATEAGKAMFYLGLRRSSMGSNASRADSDRTLALLSRVDFEPSRTAAAKLRVPSLVAYCKDDEIVEPAIVEELLRELPSARRLVFERGGHVPQRQHAQAIASAMVELATGVREGAAALAP